MKRKLLIYLIAVALLSSALDSSVASHLEPRLFLRRQANQGESEQESTTAKSASESSDQQQPPGTTQTPAVNDNNYAPVPNHGRLYPDLPQGPTVFLPPFNGHVPQPNRPMGPFVPFNVVPAGGQRLNADQMPGPFGPRMLPPPPRPISAAERLQSQSFTNGLGKRLLTLIGVDMSQQQSANQSQPMDGTDNNIGSPRSLDGMSGQTMSPLQNMTILNEMNKRVGMLMSGLSKMYNSTIREQLQLLNERFKKEAENSTNPWQQRVAQRVPEFFNQMAMRVNGAQEQLNHVWRDVLQAANGNTSVLVRQAPQQQGQPSFFHSIDQFVNSDHENGGNFIDQISRSIGMQLSDGSQPQRAPNQTLQDLGARLREFWHVQVQPQVGMMRNQMARVWRDLTTSGALTPDTMMRARAVHPKDSNSSASSDLINSILGEANTESAEYALVAPRNSDDGQSGKQEGQDNSAMPKVSPQIQNRLMSLQRDLNQLWQGLSSSLQNAVANARATLNPRPMFGPNIGPSGNQMDNDPAQNLINSKVQDLSRVQREADVVYDTIQQQQREAQQRQTIADRMKAFMQGVDLRNFNQLPEQIGNKINRFGAVLGNFWNTLPERWDNLMAQRQNQANQARIEAQLHSRTTTSSTTPASTADNSIA